MKIVWTFYSYNYSSNIVLSLVHFTVDHSAVHSNVSSLYKQAGDTDRDSEEKDGTCLFCPEKDLEVSQARIPIVLYMVNTAVVPLCGMSD